MIPTPPDGGPTREAKGAANEVRVYWMRYQTGWAVTDLPIMAEIIDRHFAPLRARQTELERVAKQLAEALAIAKNTAECDILSKDGQELPWYRACKAALAAYRTLTAREGK